MPAHIKPMLATLADMPPEFEKFGFEYKWDGIRIVCFWDGERLRLETRNLLDVTDSYPELAGIGLALGDRRAVLDGELVALGENGSPSFNLLQHRMGLLDERELDARVRQIPVSFMIFDLVYLDGSSIMQLGYMERRRLLEELNLAGPSWATPPSERGQGEAMLGVAREKGLEGIIAKRLDSLYVPGLRSRAWLKVKIVKRQEFVIGGWSHGAKGGGTLGALLLGYYDMTRAEAKRAGTRQKLRYAGKVGTGFSEAERDLMRNLLEERERDESSFDEPLKEQGVRFAEPGLVAEVEFRGWTGANRLRHPSFKGLRNDKAPEDVVLELETYGRD